MDLKKLAYHPVFTDKAPDPLMPIENDIKHAINLYKDRNKTTLMDLDQTATIYYYPGGEWIDMVVGGNIVLVVSRQNPQTRLFYYEPAPFNIQKRIKDLGAHGYVTKKISDFF